MDATKNMHIMLKDMSQCEEQIQAKIKDYGRLCQALETQQAKIEKLKRELKEFERFFQLFEVSEQARTRSVHFTALGEEVQRLSQSIRGDVIKRDSQKDFYAALEAGEFETLWCMEDGESQLAAIYYGFENIKSDICGYVKRLWDKKTSVSERVVRYLVEKSIVVSEKSMFSEEDRDKLDKVLGLIMHSEGSKIEDVTDDDFVLHIARWKRIENVLYERLATRVLVDAKGMFSEFERIFADFEAFLAESRETLEKYSEVLNKLCSDKISKAAKTKAQAAFGWWKNAVEGFEKEIEKCRQEDQEIRKLSLQLAEIIEQLSGADENIISEQELREVQGLLSTCRMVRDGMSFHATKKMAKQLLNDYQEKLAEVESAIREEIDAKNKAEEAKARRRIEKKERRREKKRVKKLKRREWRRRHPILNFLLILMLVCHLPSVLVTLLAIIVQIVKALLM